MTENNLNKIFEIPQNYIQAVVDTNNHLNSLLLLGGWGQGKSFNTLKVLDEMGADYVYKSGFTTPKGLYKFLYEYGTIEEKVIVFDDTHGLVDNKNSVSLLLNALNSDEQERVLSWESSNESYKDDVPPEFTFKAKLIIITNELPKNLSAELIKSRALVYRFDLSNYEIIQVMEEIADRDGDLLKREDRQEVLKFIKENVDASVKDFDLRTQKTLENLYAYDKDNWKILAEPIINKKKDKKRELMQKYLKTLGSVEEAKKKWSEETGLSGRQFYRYKQKLEMQKSKN